MGKEKKQTEKTEKEQSKKTASQSLDSAKKVVEKKEVKPKTKKQKEKTSKVSRKNVKTSELEKPAQKRAKKKTAEEVEHEKIVEEFSASESSEAYKFKVEKKRSAKKKPWWKHVVNVSIIVAVSLVLVVGGYVGYLQASYSRIFDHQSLAVENNVAKFVNPGETYSIMTYNIGFGAYSPDYTFFMDEGGYKSGKNTKGENSRALSKGAVKENTTGAISTASKYNADFYFFQEVDTSSSRSYSINQLDMLKSSFKNYGTIFAENLHTAYLCYPLFNSIGKMNSGIATLSKYYAYYATRRSLPIEDGFVNKFFDLDRCISVTKIKLEKTSAKFLVLINVHLSAYDDGTIRAEQLKLLYEIMDVEYNQNKNYVVVGGDFNHAIYGEYGVYANDMVVPNWLKQFPNGYGEGKLNEMGYSIAYDQSAILNKRGTCRDSSVPYNAGKTLEVIIDGFIVSENVEIKQVQVVDTGYAYSDHNPVYMSFTLK